MADAAQRRLNARIAALELHADPVRSRAIARNARDGLYRRFEEEALTNNPNLSGADLDIAIERRRRLFYVRLAKASAQARAARRTGAAPR